MASSPVVANELIPSSYLQQARSGVARLISESKPEYDGLYLYWTTIIHGSSDVAADHNNTEHDQFSTFNYVIVSQPFLSRNSRELYYASGVSSEVDGWLISVAKINISNVVEAIIILCANWQRKNRLSLSWILLQEFDLVFSSSSGRSVTVCDAFVECWSHDQLRRYEWNKMLHQIRFLTDILIVVVI